MSGQQLLSIIERIERLPKHESVSAAREALASSDDRHRYCLGPLTAWDYCNIPSVSRAQTAAGRMLGCKNDTVRHRAAMWKRRGSYEAARDWAAELNGQPWPVCELPSDCVGYVYVLSCPAFEGLFKVGFSRDPEHRAKALASQYKVALRLEHAQVATWLDEHVAHTSLLQFQMANEWFDVSRSWAGKLPLSLFYAPKRMWRELHEAA